MRREEALERADGDERIAQMLRRAWICEKSAEALRADAAKELWLKRHPEARKASAVRDFTASALAGEA